MRRMLHLLFVVCLSVSLYAQNPTVVLTTIGEGYSVDEARDHALRTAIEEAYATFISSDLTIVNDEIEKEEIVIIASASCVSTTF